MSSGNTRELTLVVGDAWAGIYEHGKLISEGHGISVYALAALVKGEPIRIVKYIVPVQSWLDDVGTLPELLEDVLRERAEVFK